MSENQTNNSKLQPAPIIALASLLDDMGNDADAAYDARQTGNPRGVITGIPGIDSELNGALAPGLNIIHGNAGSGKTALMLQTACDCQCPALFITCEMAPAELLRRITARKTGKYLGRLKSGEYSGDKVRELARQAIAQVPQLFIMDATRGGLTPEATDRNTKGYILERAQACMAQFPDAKHFLLAIDSLQTFTQCVTGDASGEYEALNMGIRAVQTIAGELNQPVMLTSERNRDSMKSGGVNAGAGTRKIEYQSETVIGLSQVCDKEGEPLPSDVSGKKEIVLKLVKNRHGDTNKKIYLNFHGALQSFTEAEQNANLDAILDGGNNGHKAVKVSKRRALV